MFAFALKMLWEAWRMGEGELEETQKEVEQELAELDDGQPQVHNVSMHCMVHTLLVYVTLWFAFVIMVIAVAAHRQ